MDIKGCVILIKFYPFDRPFSIYSVGHILGGIVTICSGIISPYISLLLFSGFTIYEWVEQEKINDEMYRDYVEFLLGMFLCSLLMLAIQ